MEEMFKEPGAPNEKVLDRRFGGNAQLPPEGLTAATIGSSKTGQSIPLEGQTVHSLSPPEGKDQAAATPPGLEGQVKVMVKHTVAEEGRAMAKELPSAHDSLRERCTHSGQRIHCQKEKGRSGGHSKKGLR